MRSTGQQSQTVAVSGLHFFVLFFCHLHLSRLPVAKVGGKYGELYVTDKMPVALAPKITNGTFFYEPPSDYYNSTMSGDDDENWATIEDKKVRRRIQNRHSQRKRRKYPGAVVSMDFAPRWHGTGLTQARRCLQERS